MALYENLLVLAGIILALVVTRTLRRPGGGQRGYAAVLGLQLVLILTALVQEDRYLGTVAISLCALTVVLPALLERAARHMFGRGRATLAVRLGSPDLGVEHGHARLSSAARPPRPTRA